MNMRCYICDGKISLIGIKDGYICYKCPDCQLVRIDPVVTEEYLRSEIYSEKVGYHQFQEKCLEKLIESSKTKKNLDYLDSEHVKGRLLDVGCAEGAFMYFAKKRGYDVFGVEINKFTVDIAQKNGLNVFFGTLQEAKFDDGYFSIINLGDIIEHLINPIDLLVECKRILCDDGVVLVATPNMDCFWSKITLKLFHLFKIPWSSCTPPHHLFQFSKNNLDLLFKKLGFECVYTWYEKVPSLKYELGAIGVYQKWKKTKSLKDLIFMLFAFSLYTVVFCIDRIVSLFVKKNFAMHCVYKPKTC